MKLKMLITFILFLNTISVFGYDFNFAPLEFSNRAQCSELSTLPARSAFLMIDSFNAGKAGFSQGLKVKNKGFQSEPKAWAADSVKLFRLWSTYLAYEILQKLIDGKLPLIPIEIDSNTKWSFYKKASDACVNNKNFLNCKKINNLLSDFWSKSHLKNANFKRFGLESNDFFTTSKKPSLGCHIIRKFSSFQSHLKSQYADYGMLKELSSQLQRPNKYIDSCFSYQSDKDPRFATIQFDIADISNEENWNSIGFKFWNSFKLFYSWAWRHAPEYKHKFGKYKKSFSSIPFEDSAMLVPNGCRTITKPKCDSNGLSTDAMRAALFLGQTHAATKEVPVKPIDILFQGQVRSVNQDELGLFKEGTQDAWYRKFQKNLSSIRFLMVDKLSSSLAKLNIVSYLTTAKTISKDILKELENKTIDKQEAYLMCFEYGLAKNQLFDDIYQEVLNIKKNGDLDSFIGIDSSKNLKNNVEYLVELQQSVQSFCKSAEKKGLLKIDQPEIHLSLNEWAYYVRHPREREKYDFRCNKEPGHIACPKNIDKKYLVTNIENDGADKEIVVCKTSFECARTYLKGLVSIISVRRYAEAFLPLQDTISNPNLFNNYTMPTACGMYDPWAQKRATWKIFMSDMASALIYGGSCGALSLRMDGLGHKKVIQFDELHKKNVTLYKPVLRKEKMKWSVGSDFGFLMGVPCALAYGNSMDTNADRFNVYNGVSLGVCKKNHNAKYKTDTSTGRPVIIRTDSKTYAGCFRCTFSPSNVAKTFNAAKCIGSYPARALTLSGIGMIQAVMRLFNNLSDKDNIIRTQMVNMDQISKTFEDRGTIPKDCHKSLTKGFVCKKFDTKKEKVKIKKSKL